MRLLHAPPSLAARGFTCRRKKKQAAGEIQSGFSLLPHRQWLLPLPATRNTKKRPQTVDFSFFFLCFSDLHFSFLLLRTYFLRVSLLWVSSSSPLLRVAGLAIVEGGSGVDDLHSCWLSRRLGLLLEEEGVAARGEGCRVRSVIEVKSEGIVEVCKILNLQVMAALLWLLGGGFGSVGAVRGCLVAGWFSVGGWLREERLGEGRWIWSGGSGHERSKIEN